MRFVRYLALPLSACSGGFLPARDAPRRIFHPTMRPSENDGGIRKVCLSKRPGFSRRKECNNNSKANDDHNHNDAAAAAAVVAETSTNGIIGRRTALILSGAAAVATTGTAEASTNPVSRSGRQESPRAVDGDTATSVARNLLESSSVYRVQTSPTTATRGKGPSVKKVSNEGLLHDLRSKRALFLGEHHPERRDHRLQAALVRSLHDSLSTHHTDGDSPASATLVVGLEAVQRQFQPVLDNYCSGSIDEEELRRETEWDSRWYWSFEAYAPIFRTCRELGIDLLALDISTEDRVKVETGGLEALHPETLEEYLPDRGGFDAFGSTKAYEAFVSYTLKPPYELQQRTPLGKRSTTTNNTTFSNFVARQMLRDGSMASAAFGWLKKNPNGILVGCIGINHATFGCGVPERLEQMLSSSVPISNDTPPTRQKVNNNSKPEDRLVASILINPEPLNTGTELKICRNEGKSPVVDDDDDESDVVGRIFLPNKGNQVCIENSIELQNYALQLGYFPQSGDPRGRRTAINEAAAALQARKGRDVLGLSDYLVFSPKETATHA